MGRSEERRKGRRKDRDRKKGMDWCKRRLRDVGLLRKGENAVRKWEMTERGVFLGRRWRRVAGEEAKREGGVESDKEKNREGETACLNGELRKETTCPRRFILVKTKKRLIGKGR